MRLSIPETQAVVMPTLYSKMDVYGTFRVTPADARAQIPSDDRSEIAKGLGKNSHRLSGS